MDDPAVTHRHILTVAVEDYFQGTAFADLIDPRHWSRFEARIERNTLAALDLLNRHSARATFFFMRWVAEHHSELVREVVRRGHEVASSGDSKRSFRKISRQEFRDEIQRSRDLLEDCSGVKVRGFRIADHHLRREDLWALRVLAQHGYEYDSSVNPYLWSFRNEPWRRFVHQERFEDASLWEIPLSSVQAFGVHIPVAGGNWFRQLPEAFVQRSIRSWDRVNPAPFVMYFRVWDLDPDQPVLTGVPRVSQLRHYRNADRVQRLVERFLTDYQFSTIAGHLGLESQRVAARPRLDLGHEPAAISPELTNNRTPVTVVIPCYNEESALPYLANTLRGVERAFTDYRLRFLFVNDGSSDATRDTLDRLFGAKENCEIAHHERNQGVAAAILTGLRHARTEIVCSMDCDCTYDPNDLNKMLPLLTPGIDLVTASPYHPDGHVLRVPGWRLALSKSASALYRIVLRQSLYTYTSCFRVYRRSAVVGLAVRETGFLGVAEILGRLDLNGSRIVEFPATLHVRMLGRSKMRVLKTIAGHVRLMSRFALERLLGKTEPLKASAAASDFCSTVYAPKGIHRD
jgi:polysaccharide deacetylase family protein (PEP-CTERM system associated)